MARSEWRDQQRRPLSGSLGFRPGFPGVAGSVLLGCFCLGLAGQSEGPKERADGSVRPAPGLQSSQPVNKTGIPERIPLSNTSGSVESLGRHFLEVLARGSREELKSLALNRTEFEQWVYPALPASRPNSNLSAEFLWQQTLLKSQAGLNQTMEMAGRKFEFVAIRFEEGEKKYDGFRIHRDSRLLLKDEEGREDEYKLFGSVIEADGQFKIYSYVR